MTDYIKTSVYLSPVNKKKFNALSILIQNMKKIDLTNKIFENGISKIVKEFNLEKEFEDLLKIIK
jgi:hypothetical protein